MPGVDPAKLGLSHLLIAWSAEETDSSGVRTMSELPHSQAIIKTNLNEEPQRLERRGSNLVPAAVLEKTQEFFQICDSEGKGYITRTDLRKLHKELPLSAEELENVFDSLDSDRNGYLTLGEFSLGFSDFLHGRKMSEAEDQMAEISHEDSESIFQEEPQVRNEDEEERHFSMLMDRLGAKNVFEDPSEVRSLWAQLRKDEPHLLYNFEEFLARVTSQMRLAQKERKEMECALRQKSATHDSEIQCLYEEMEQQIKTEKDRLLLKDSELRQLRSQDLQQQLSRKEQELEQVFLKQGRLEQQCVMLHSEHQESRVENVKLKMTNDELSSELERTSQELSLAQEQLALLQEQASRLQQEREMEMYRITEGLQREKQSLMKQLDLLREMNKHLRDERDISTLKSNNSLKKLDQKQRATLSSVKHSDTKQATKSETCTEEMTQQEANRKPSSLLNGHRPHMAAVADGKVSITECALGTSGGPLAANIGPDLVDAPPDGWPLRRVISIEEDHLPHLLQGDAHLLLHQLSEEDEGGQDENVPSKLGMYSSNMSLASADSSPPSTRVKNSFKKGRIRSVPFPARSQPVGKEAIKKSPAEGAVAAPERLFKVIIVGNSSVGKTALLRRFCDGRFHSATTATVGIDYSVRTLNLGESHVALQLWDTAGQERYRSITKQFFRKADGVVVIYDITMYDSFRAVRPWLASIQEAVGDPIPIMLLGNKSDKESMREVSIKEGARFAKEACLMFYECSAYTGSNVLEAMTHLARLLKEQEDRVWENTVRLVDQPMKKKSCCK